MRLITRSLRRSSHLAVLAVGAGALAFGLIGPALATTQTGQLTVIDSTSGDFWALAGVNTNVGSVSLVGAGFSDNQVGTAGYVTGANAVAVEGYSASTGPTAYGVYGLSQTGNGIYGVNTNGAVASIYGYNTATGGTAMYGYSTGGNAVLGTSTKTNGVVGITQSPGSISTYYAGVLGMDTSSASSNYGLAGTSANGTAIYGNSQVGYGVLGVESSTSGGASAAGIGGFSNQGAGGQFESAHNAGLIAQSVLALADLSLPSGEAGLFTGSSGTAADPVVVVLSDVAGTDYFATYNNSVGGTPQTFIIQAGSANYSGKAPANSSDVQVSGDLYVQGQVYSLCSSSGGAFPVTSPHSHCVYSNSTSPAVRIRSGTGADVTAYEPHQSVPTMEDFGEAQLSNGVATVPLEATFASTIDQGRSYLVFITPEGDCHGLYVTAKSAHGFVVRELMNGHSSVAFQYRIVAHPYGDASARLPAVPAVSHTATLARSNFVVPKAPKPLVLPRPVTLGPIPQRLPPPATPSFKKLNSKL